MTNARLKKWQRLLFGTILTLAFSSWNVSLFQMTNAGLKKWEQRDVVHDANHSRFGVGFETFNFTKQKRSKKQKHTEKVSTSSGATLLSRASVTLDDAFCRDVGTNYSSGPTITKDTRPSTRKTTATISHGAQGQISRKNRTCALLFFGLVKHFKELALPSIQRNIIEKNKHCDIFAHTTNVSYVPTNPRNKEVELVTASPFEVFLLTKNVVMDTVDTFYHERWAFLQHTQLNYHRRWGQCCTSHNKMVKQWHSIDKVWNLMKQHVKNGTGVSHYEQVGLFRLDLYYASPVDIFDSDASLASFHRWGGVNDRMFYGRYNHAEKWAHRFEFSKTFEKLYMNRPGQKQGYHAETFVKSLLLHYKISVLMKDICFWRIRTGFRIQVIDCLEMSAFNEHHEISRLLPPGCKLVKKEGR